MLFLGVLPALAPMLLRPGSARAQAANAATSQPQRDADLDALLSSDLEELLAVPAVELASKRMQSSYDAPAAITVLHAHEIAAHVAPNVADLLRRVLGVHVMQVNANEYNIGMRGVNRLINNRVLVLVDGRRLHEPLQGYAQWDLLPAHPAEVERIEILRGPSSTVYGADAFSGVVNIVTKSPFDQRGTEAAAASSLHYLRPRPGDAPERGRLHSGGQTYAAYTWRNVRDTLGLRTSIGILRVPEWSDPHGGALWRHGPHAARAMASLAYHPDPGLQLRGGASYVSSETLQGSTAAAERRPVYATEAATWLRVRKTGIRGVPGLALKGSFDASSGTLWRGGTTVIGTLGIVSSRTTRLHSDLQCDLSSFEERNTLTLGLESTYQQSSEIFGVAPSKRMVAVVAQDEAILLTSPTLLLSLGARLEYYDSSDRRGTTVRLRNLSPRGALIWRPNATQSVRLAAASAYRTATAFEGLVNVGFQLQPEPIPRNIFVAANPRVRPERVVSVEL